MSINTSLCYLEKDGKYLLLHRTKKEGDLNRDKWIGVGGKFEAGESPEECAVREIREETGLCAVPIYRGIVTFVSDKWPTEYMHLFTATSFAGEMIECDEGELAWVDKDKVTALPIWQGDRIFLDLLAKGAPFFSLKLVYCGDTLTEAILNGEKLPL